MPAKSKVRKINNVREGKHASSDAFETDRFFDETIHYPHLGDPLSRPPMLLNRHFDFFAQMLYTLWVGS